MYRTSVVGNSVKQTARSLFMFRIIFQDFCCGNRVKNFVECDVLLCHLLLSVLSDTNALCYRLSADALQNRFQIDLNRFVH